MSVSTLQWAAHVLRREVIAGRRSVAAIGLCATVTCLTLGAYARIPLPFTPVPLTLQTFFVLVAGAALGPRLGTLSLAAYLLLGTVGLPVFTTPWLGATAGYLVGFVVAGWLIGVLVSGAGVASTGRLVLAMGLGTLVIWLFGAAWLAHVFRLGAWQAIQLGVAPYVAGDALKLLAAVAFCRTYRARLRVLFP